MKKRIRHYPKTTLARRLGISRTTLQKYLGTVGAPKPDAAGRYPLAPVRRWIEATAPTAGEHPATKRLRGERLRLQCVGLERAGELESGTYLRRNEVGPSVERCITEQTLTLEKWFVHDLPPQWVGLRALEIQQLNIGALDAIAEHIKYGKWETPEPESESPAVVVVDPGEQTETDPIRRLKRRRLKAEVAMLALREQVAAGVLVPASEISRVVFPAMLAADQTIRQKFEFELPFKHGGKSRKEVAAMYADALAGILLRLRKDLLPLLSADSGQRRHG